VILQEVGGRGEGVFAESLRSGATSPDQNLGLGIDNVGKATFEHTSVQMLTLGINLLLAEASILLRDLVKLDVVD
jgi:hypothetical protein